MKTLIATCMAITGLCSMALVEISEKDREFAREAAAAGMLEVKLGEWASKNASSSEVRKLGTRMAADHTKANSELKAMAVKNGIDLPASLSEKQLEKYNELVQMKGAGFDKAYSDCVVESHQKMLHVFEKHAKDGEDIDMKAFAAKMTPVLEHHVYLSKQACEKLKKRKK